MWWRKHWSGLRKANVRKIEARRMGGLLLVKKMNKKFGVLKICCTFAVPNGSIAQLV